MNETDASNIPTNLPTNLPATAAVEPVAAPAKPALAPGWQTSEFWLTTLGQVGLVFAAASGALPSKYAAFAGALSTVAYNLSRGISKAAAAR